VARAYVVGVGITKSNLSSGGELAYHSGCSTFHSFHLGDARPRQTSPLERKRQLIRDLASFAKQCEAGTSECCICRLSFDLSFAGCQRCIPASGCISKWHQLRRGQAGQRFILTGPASHQLVLRRYAMDKGCTNPAGSRRRNFAAA
jgi:hypothetical protein